MLAILLYGGVPAGISHVRVGVSETPIEAAAGFVMFTVGCAFKVNATENRTKTDKKNLEYFMYLFL